MNECPCKYFHDAFCLAADHFELFGAIRSEDVTLVRGIVALGPSVNIISEGKYPFSNSSLSPSSTVSSDSYYLPRFSIILYCQPTFRMCGDVSAPCGSFLSQC